MARRLVQSGDTVEWFSATFPHAPSDETLNGVRIVRAGTQSTVHWNAYRRYRRGLLTHFDVVVDQVNTFPFFTPLWSEIPAVMFIHQLAREVWWYESYFPLNVLGYLAETLYLRVYRHMPVVTVSNSTRQDLLRLGFVGRIHIIPEGIEATRTLKMSRADVPSFAYVGRLAPSKRVADIVVAFALFCQTHGTARLSIVGEGAPKYVKYLHRLSEQMGVQHSIRFVGRVSAEQRDREMASAHALLLASVREGWGLVVTEANALGTPAVAYDVPGLRDSIRDGETGLLTSQSPQALAAAMARLWHDRALHSRLARAALDWSSSFSLETSTELFRHELEHAIAHSKLRHLAAGE